MKFIPSKLIDIIAENYESSENIIDQQGEIYCKTLTDYDSKIQFKNGIKYFGSIENGILNGKGTIIMPNGVKFTGKFINNQIEGRGLLEYSDTEYYDGEIQNLQRNGQGKYENKQNGIFYKGQWQNDQFHGQGLLRVQDQWEYEGEFQNGIKQGQGTVRYQKSQNIFQGNFLDNQKNGYGEMSWKKEKQLYKGNWTNNKLNGFGVYIYESDFQGKKNLRNYYIGEFINNNREGFGIHYYSDSSLYIGFWKDGQKNGKAIFIDNNGFQNLKQFKDNHLIHTQYIQDIGFSDFQIPRIEFVGIENDNWNHQILEKVVKTLNPNLRQIFEEIISSQQIFENIIKSVSLERFLQLLKKVRFYDQFIDQNVAKDIIQKHSSCFFNVLLDLQEFSGIKKNFQNFIDGKVNVFRLAQKFNKYSTMNYLQFINSLFIVLQYKYQDSQNIERDIRSFVSLRLIGIFKNKLRVKEWVKEEKLTLMKYKKTIMKNEDKFQKYFQVTSKNKKTISLKSFWEMISFQGILNIQNKQDVLLLLKTLERNNDPVTSCYDELKNSQNLQSLLLNKKFNSFLNLEMNYIQFQQNLVLVIHNKFLQNKLDVQKNTIQYIESIQFKNKSDQKFQFRIFKRQQKSDKNLFKTSQNSEQEIQIQKTEQQIQENTIEEQQQIKIEQIQSINEIEQQDQIQQDQKTISEIDSFADGYFIKMDSKDVMQIINYFNYLTKNFKQQYVNEIFCIFIFVFIYKSICI